MSTVIQSQWVSSNAVSTQIVLNQSTSKGSGIIVYFAANQTGWTTITVSDTQGNTYSSAVMSSIIIDAGGNKEWSAILYALNSPGGADTLTITLGGGSGTGSLNFIFVAEVNSLGVALDGTASAGAKQDGGTLPSMSLPVSNNGEFAFTGASLLNGTLAPPAGYTSSNSGESGGNTWVAWASVNSGTNTIQWGGSFVPFNDVFTAVAASFSLPPVPVPPAQAVVGNKTGNAIQFFGVTPTTPAVVQTQSNAPQVFTFDTTSHGGVPVVWRFGDDGNFLGRSAMPGQLLVLPSSGWFRGTNYFVCASGTVTIPLSAQNAGVSFTLYSNKFVNLTPGAGLNIQVSSDVLATLPNSPLGPNPNSYQFSLVGSLGGSLLGAGSSAASTSAAACAAVWNFNGVLFNSSGSSTVDNGVTGPKLQLSLAVQFSGSVSGNDQFAATCSQFEIQET